MAHDRLLGRLEQQKIRPHWITAWGTPSVVLALRPVAGTAPATAAELAAALREASRPPASVLLPRRSGWIAGGGARLVVVPAGAPVDPERHVPAAGTLLGRPVLVGRRAMAPAAALTLREEVVQPRIARQSGRFVLPIEVQLPQRGGRCGSAGARRWTAAWDLALPPGVDLERPPSRRRFGKTSGCASPCPRSSSPCSSPPWRPGGSARPCGRWRCSCRSPPA